MTKEVLAKAKADIIILQQSKKQVVDRKLCAEILENRWKDWIFLHQIGTACGVVILWKEVEDIVSYKMGDFSITYKVGVGCGSVYVILQGCMPHV